MKYLKVFVSFDEDTQMLTEAEMGRLFRAMLRYADTAEAVDLRGNERYVWPAAKRTIDDQRDSYKERCETNKRIATNRYESLRDDTKRDESLRECTNREKNKDKNIKEIIPKGITKKAAFAAPTIEEVRSYCSERKNTVNPEAFISYYDSIGWMIGSKKMKDWKAAVRTWEQREERKPGKRMGGNAGYAQTKISDAEFDALFANEGF